MTKNQKVAGVVAAVIIAAGSFWGGMVYAQHAVPARGHLAAGGPFAGRTGGGFSGRGGGAVTGQIISNDGSSLTIKLSDGSTKIVLLSASTTVMVASSAAPSSLTAGTNVMVTGASNSDGSVTAQQVMVRPALRTQQ